MAGPRFAFDWKSFHCAALKMPNVKRTGYGLGKHGWVSAKFSKSDRPSIELLRQWVNESFRLVAPKKLVDALEELAGLPGADYFFFNVNTPADYEEAQQILLRNSDSAG